MISGEFDVEAMKSNIREAIKVYIERVDGTPSMGTTIKLFKGVERSWYHIRRSALLIFLKGSKAGKEKLEAERPLWYKHFQSIWKLRQSHMVQSSIPSKYAFILKCCGSARCIHPSCTGQPIQVDWFVNGPSIGKILPTPVIELQSPDGRTCSKCPKACAGHYKTGIPTDTDTIAPVPSVLIAEDVEKDPNFDAERIVSIARKCIVLPQTVQFYVNHLKQVKLNRARGVVKAQKTRMAKKKGQNKM